MCRALFAGVAGACGFDPGGKVQQLVRMWLLRGTQSSMGPGGAWWGRSILGQWNHHLGGKHLYI